jgi:hypothetical protein
MITCMQIEVSNKQMSIHLAQDTRRILNDISLNLRKHAIEGKVWGGKESSFAMKIFSTNRID